MNRAAHTDPRDWKRTEKSNGAYSFVSSQFVVTALMSARGLERAEAESQVRGAVPGGNLVTDHFVYERLGVQS